MCSGATQCEVIRNASTGSHPWPPRGEDTIPLRVAFTVMILLLVAPYTARAVPSFARQLGVGCTACHTDFPQLTPFGRQFKLNGYTMGEGQTHLPPLAVMVQAPAFTHTSAGQPGGAAPHFDANDNVAVNQISLFYAGRALRALRQGSLRGEGRRRTRPRGHLCPGKLGRGGQGLELG